MRDLPTRPCCGTYYNCHHLNDCPVGGADVIAALPCSIQLDGWCATHSTMSGPAYCEGRKQ